MYKMIAVAALTIGMASSAMAQNSNADASGGTSGANGTTTTDTNTSGAAGVNGANGAVGSNSTNSTTQTTGKQKNCGGADSSTSTGTMKAAPKTSSNSAGSGTCD